MPSQPFTIEIPQTTEDNLQQLTELLIHTVHNGASVGFMHSLDAGQAKAFWLDCFYHMSLKHRVVFAARNKSNHKLVGVVQLVINLPENQPHRANISKLLVHSSARRKGIASALIKTAEEHAGKLNKYLLVLDTETGSDAEKLYSKLEWQRVGVIPHYALMPDGAPCDSTFFYKELD